MLVELSILVWNTHGVPLIGSNPKEVAEFVAQQNTDIAFLQEVWTERRALMLRPENGYVLRWVGAGLVTVVRYDEPSCVGSYEVRFKDTTWSRMDWLVKKGAVFSINEDFVMFVNTHLDAGRDEESIIVRARQLDQLLAEIKRHNGPVVLVGDLNLKPQEPLDGQVLAAFYRNGEFTVAAQGSNGKDFILTRGDVSVKNVVEHKNKISDHFALTATVAYDND